MGSHAKVERLASDLRTLAFPTGSTDNHVSDLHARLAEYDGYVAGLVERRVAGESLAEHVQRDDELGSELTAVIASGREPATSDARRLLQYLQAVHELVDAVSKEKE